MVRVDDRGGGGSRHLLTVVWARDVWHALVWFVKLGTDPLTDLVAYTPRYLRGA